MPPQLVALTEGPNILLDKPILLVGRHPECDIRVDSRKVSRRHCCIAQVGECLVVRDLGSTNGVRINGKRVQEGRLQPGDELTIGNNRFKVAWDSLDDHLPRDNRVREPAPRPPAVQPVLPPDELLESGEEPMPRPEPGDDVVPTPQAKRQGPPVGRFVSTQHDSQPGSLILPEHIELAPSDVLPNPPASPPAS
jgi:pSer/pThr/pTyr-binding forkhead associated (FHA) protein